MVQRVLPRQICRLVLLSVIAVCCSPCHGQLNRIKPPYAFKPIKNTPLAPRTLVPPSKEATSSVGIVPVSPYIDEKGIVWSNGISNKPVGKAAIKYFKRVSLRPGGYQTTRTATELLNPAERPRNTIELRHWETLPMMTMHPQRSKNPRPRCPSAHESIRRPDRLPGRCCEMVR